jgi:hypothetical protein
VTDARRLVDKLWSYCNVLRDDGVGTLEYTEQLTYLLFLKMAHERATRSLRPERIVPEGDRANLDITWLRDEPLEDLDNLPAPEAIAREIVEDLRAALAEFEAVAAALEAGDEARSANV